MYNNRQFAIFSTSQLSKVNFSEVLETLIDTVRKSVDGTKTFVKWDGETVPTSITTIVVDGFYTYEEMLEILNTLEWTEPVEGMK